MKPSNLERTLQDQQEELRGTATHSDKAPMRLRFRDLHVPDDGAESDAREASWRTKYWWGVTMPNAVIFIAGGALLCALNVKATNTRHRALSIGIGIIGLGAAYLCCSGIRLLYLNKNIGAEAFITDPAKEYGEQDGDVLQIDDVASPATQFQETEPLVPGPDQPEEALASANAVIAAGASPNNASFQ